MNQHLGSNDDALLFEHAVAALGNLFEADPDQIPRAVGPLALESLLERITLTFMTEIALHRVALQVMKQIGVSHPLERYTHLQNK
jgi:hypothetical protein